MPSAEVAVDGGLQPLKHRGEVAQEEQGHHQVERLRCRLPPNTSRTIHTLYGSDMQVSQSLYCPLKPTESVFITALAAVEAGSAIVTQSVIRLSITIQQ